MNIGEISLAINTVFFFELLIMTFDNLSHFEQNYTFKIAK